MKLKSILMMLTLTIIGAVKIQAQTTDCVKQKEHKPENDCSPCSLDSKYNVIVENFLLVDEIYKMEEELNKMVALADSMYKTHGNVKQRYFDVLDLDIKKLFNDMEKNPQKAKDLISWMDGILEQAGCTKTSTADTRSSGIADGGMLNIVDNLSTAINNFKYPSYTGPDVLTFDCCQDTRWQPNDQFISNAQQIHNQFMAFKKMFEDFKQLQLVQMSAVKMAALQFQQYDEESKKKMESLVNSSFFNVISSLLAQSNVITSAQANALNNIIANYAANKDKLSASNAIRQLLGNDAAEVYGFMFDNFTAEELLGSFGDLVKNNPAKFKSLQKLGGVSKVTGALAGFMNLVQIAQAAVNVFFDTFLKLGGNVYVIRTQNELWCITAKYYYYAVQSLLSNAAALYRMKTALLRNLSFFPNATIPMSGIDPLSSESIKQKISTAFGSNVNGILQGNQYRIDLPGEQHVVIVFGNYLCGIITNHDKPATTPDPKDKKNTSKSAGEPGLPPVEYQSRTINKLNNKQSKNNAKKAWRVDFTIGTGYYSANTTAPIFSGINETSFVQQQQAVLNSSYKGTVFATGNTINVKSFSAAAAGFEFGRKLNNMVELNAGFTGQWQKVEAKTSVNVVKVIIQSPSQPPVTRQSNEELNAKTGMAILKIKFGPRIYFGTHHQLFAGLKGCYAVSISKKIIYKAGDNNFNIDKVEKLVSAGASINAGIKVPAGKRCTFKFEAGADFLSIKQSLAIAPEMTAVLAIKL
jgi:hypothetical protein